MSELKNRIDFVYLFDVQDGNPNGDPDAGNLPRIDAETGMGLVTDVCLKRKVRNYVQSAKENIERFDIYVKEKAVLGRSHVAAFKALGYEIGEESRKLIPGSILETINEYSLPEGLSIESYDADNSIFVVAGDVEKKEIKQWIKDEKVDKEVSKFINSVLKDAKPRKPSVEEIEGGRIWMCNHFYDIRTFGAVLSIKSAPNCGQVRGPIQFTFARSVNPIVTKGHSITRMAVTKEEDLSKERTMGRKATIPYGLYLCHGFISANLAKQTGFDESDLELFWEALKNMFDVDRSAARGLMSAQKLIIFKHDSELGNAPANKLFDLVKVERKDTTKPARSFNDYTVTIDKSSVPNGVEVIEML